MQHVSRIRYSAPEIITQPQQQQPQMVTVREAEDVWAVGLIGFELLTGERVFAEGASEQEIRAALCWRVAMGSMGAWSRGACLQAAWPSPSGSCLPGQGPSQTPQCSLSAVLLGACL